MQGNGNARREFVAVNEIGSLIISIAAVHDARESVEAEIDRGAAPGGLLDGTEAHFRHIAEGHAGGWNGGSGRSCGCGRNCGDGKGEKALVVEAREIEAEPARIIGQKNGAANFGIGGFAETVRERKPEGERGELIVVGDEPPASGKQGLDFNTLLLTTLRAAGAIGIEQAAVIDTEIGVGDRGIFERLGAEFAAFENAAAAHELRANRGIHPGHGSEIKGVAKDEALTRALANIRDEDSRLADFAAGGSGDVGKPD